MSTIDGSRLDDIGVVTASQPVLSPIVPYSSGRGRATVVIVLFGAGICLVVVMFVLHLLLYFQMDRMKRGQPVSETELDTNYYAQLALSLIYAIWWLATVIAFLMWTHRAHRNLHSLGATDLEFSPAGAVGWYFFPFLNLYKPYQVMREIYNASNPDDLRYQITRWSDHGPMIVKTWWALFLLMSVASRAVNRMSAYPDTPGSFQFVAGASIVDDVITIATMLVAIVLVRSIDHRQRVRATSLSAVSLL
jgi:hypothetical protein